MTTRKYISGAAFVLLLLLGAPACAGSIQIHLVSQHAGESTKLNQDNYGIGWTGDGDIAPTVGYYTNSWFRDSVYAGFTFRPSRAVSFSLVGVTGYKGTSDSADRFMLDGGIMPMPMLHWLVLPDREISPLLTFAPTQDGGVVLLSINVSL